MSSLQANLIHKLKPCPGPKIPNSYIVLFKDGTTLDTQKSMFQAEHFPDIHHIFLPHFDAPGFSPDVDSRARSSSLDSGSRISSGT